MKKFIPKHRWQNVVFSKASVFLLFLLLVFMANATWNRYQKYRESQKYKEELSFELSRLQEREKDLKDDIERLKTERGVEEELRKNFGISKDGERVIIITGDADKKSDKDEHKEKDTFWAKFLDIF